MPIYTPGKVVLRNQLPADTDADAYIAAVEAADGQALEPGVKFAIKNFVLCCKQDGIWTAIKASCILAGARTLNGALVPLVGTAPTRFGTEGGWNYNRKTGLQGNGTNNYLNSNRLGNADPQNNVHCSIFVSTSLSGNGAYMGVRNSTAPFNGDTSIGTFVGGATPFIFLSNRSSDATTFTASNQNRATGLIGSTRSLSASYISRVGMVDYSFTSVSFAPVAFNTYIFARNQANAVVDYAQARLAFYSIGESLDLALLDARVTDLINAIGAAIP